MKKGYTTALGMKIPAKPVTPPQMNSIGKAVAQTMRLKHLTLLQNLKVPKTPDQ